MSGGRVGRRPQLGSKWYGHERGASLVELAFALPLLIMLLVGMVSAGIAYNHQLALTHAAREGGRNAATLPVTNFTTMGDWLDEVLGQVVDDATGTLDPGVPGRYVCVAYVYPDGFTSLDQTTRLVLSGDTLGSPESAPCIADDGRPTTERRVQVVVRRDTDFNVIFFSSTITLDAEAINRFEAAQ
ncbi:MAG TPA: TadE family protein [Acidimicrobiia bacterium]|nr:TadE family protein [Acidimicrobiia bacterium]